MNLMYVYFTTVKKKNIAYTKGKGQEEIPVKFFYLQTFIYTGWKHQVSGSENRPMICSHIGLGANSQQSTQWGPDVPCMYRDLKRSEELEYDGSQSMNRSCHTSVPPTLEVEEETFALQCQQIHSGERQGRSLGFYNHPECKQWLRVYHLWKTRKWVWGEREQSLSLELVNICVSERSGQCRNTETSRENCLPAISITYVTKKGFIYRIFNSYK